MDVRASSLWNDALRAAALFAVDPYGCGGVSLRAAAGPVRDNWISALVGMLPSAQNPQRIPPSIPDSRLLGGLDFAATLHAGRPVAERGVLAAADGDVIILSMAERAGSALAARLAATLDSGMVTIARDGFSTEQPARIGLVAFDEGIGDERPPQALLDRLAFPIDLEHVSPRDAPKQGSDRGRVAAARLLLPDVRVDDAMIGALCSAALALGVAPVRASILALRVACAAAAYDGRILVNEDDAAIAARLVLGPRATQIPSQDQTGGESDAREPEPNPGDSREQSDSHAPEQERSAQELEEMVLDAAKAALPPDLLAGLLSMASAKDRGPRTDGRAGVLRQSKNRGRPIGVVSGDPRTGVRLDLVETLRAAAPWQSLRRRAVDSDHPRIEVRRADFRVKRFQQQTGATTIFVVDASGSSARKRLAEAKGAVELLLADCYVRRDQVALLAFRGVGAELVLPPTRSLTRAKRSLAGLPGGGGTPLAAAIDAACILADIERRRGQTPVIVFLTDGGANVARDGAAGRARARDDAAAAARAIEMRGHKAMLVDTSQKPQPVARELAAVMNARYLPLPYADAAAVSHAVKAGLT
jgi:magnesium chelatase subunit D